MFFRILKRDLRHKRGINLILFLFMLMATIFVVSSVNNILIVSDATKYCMKKGNVPDMYISAYEQADGRDIDEWLENNRLVNSYTKNESVILSIGNVDSFNGMDGDEYEITSTIMLQRQWNDDMLVFDGQGERFTVSDGELAMQQQVMDDNDLKVGDTMTLKFGELHKEFKITKAIMDPAFGSDMVGMTRYIISDRDYDEIVDTGISVNYSYGVDTDNYDQLLKEINKEAFSVILIIDGGMFEFSYVMHMVTAGVLIIVGVCLILIAFLILRFTIVFTLKEDYKEIGIMKAIGVRNLTIKNIYLVKYLVMITTASIIGCAVSMPVSNAMLSSLKKVILMENASSNMAVSISSAAAVALLVLAMCYMCTNGLKKYSAMDAIRSGETGERFNKKSKMTLHKSRHMSTPVFMAFNDIFSNPRRYMALLLTFIVGVIIIILPLNVITTFKSKEMAKNFMLDTDADFYLGNVTQSEDVAALDIAYLKQQMREIEENFKGKGYDISVNALAMGQIAYYVEDENDAYQFLSSIPINTDGSYVEMVDGTTPLRDDEIAFSEKALEKMGAKIGDTVYVKINGNYEKFIITASYQNYMQMGQSALFNARRDMDDFKTSQLWMTQVFDEHGSLNGVDIETIKQQFPEYTVYDMKEAMGTQLGSTEEQIEGVKLILIVVICLVNILITILMMKIFVLGEKSQIALLRSMGYSLGAIRLWHMLRFVVILFISQVLGVLISIPLNNIALRPIFGMMGATHIKIQANPLEVYIGYPALLFAVIMAAAFISSLSLKKLNIMEINNQE